MKKKVKKYFVLAAMFAFAAAGMTSCGGGSSSESEAEQIPTDGLLGDLPMLTAKSCNKIVDLRNKLFSEGLTEDEAKAIKAEFDETEKERDAQLLLSRQAIHGKEIPIEVQEGLGISFNGGLKIDSERKGVAIFAIGSGELQKDFPTGSSLNLYIIPIDTDGKAIDDSRGALWYAEDGERSLTDWKKGTKIVVKAFVSVGSTNARGYNTNEMKRWAKLAKFVVMDSNSEEFKKLKEQLEADKKAEEIEAAKKVVEEKK